MAKLKKLPSGVWFIQVARSGERKSFTDPDKYICQQKAAEWLASIPKGQYGRKPELTFQQAALAYNEERENILSPNTMKPYHAMASEDYFPFSDKLCKDIDQEDIQRYINRLAKTRSPKTCRNEHGYISAVIHSQRPDFAISTKLPQKVRLQYRTPTDKQIKALLKAIKGTHYELPVMLAAFGSLRRSEICALDASDVDRPNCIIHVRRAAVQLTGGKIIYKAPKTAAGDRYVKLPEYVISLMPKEGLVCGGINPAAISHFINQMQKKYPKLDLNFRFHDLRHYFAASQHALGVPDAYIMKAGGWDSDEVMKSVYRNALEDVSKRETKKAISHYQKLLG